MRGVTARQSAQRPRPVARRQGLHVALARDQALLLHHALPAAGSSRTGPRTLAACSVAIADFSRVRSRRASRRNDPTGSRAVRGARRRPRRSARRTGRFLPAFSAFPAKGPAVRCAPERPRRRRDKRKEVPCQESRPAGRGRLAEAEGVDAVAWQAATFGRKPFTSNFAGSQLGQFLGLATQVEGAPPERKSTHEISPLCVWACQEHCGEGVQGGVFGVFNQCFFPRTT